MTKTITTEHVYEPWFLDVLKPELERILPKDRIRIACRQSDWTKSVRVEITCDDEDELGQVEDLLQDLEDVAFDISTNKEEPS